MPFKKREKNCHLQTEHTESKKYWEQYRKNCEAGEAVKPCQYVRLDSEKYDELVEARRDGTLNILDADGRHALVRLLRPARAKSMKVQSAKETDSKNVDTYKVVQYEHISSIFE